MNTEVSIFLIVEAALFFVMLAFRSLHLHPTNITSYELKRRAKSKADKATHELRKQDLIVDLANLRYLIDTAILVIMVVYTVGFLGWIFGILVSVVLILSANVLARQAFLVNTIQRIYQKYELEILKIVEKIQPGLKFLRSPNIQPANDFSLHSKDELVHLVENAGETLSQDEKHLITHSLAFQDKPVKGVMTPRGAINSIDKKELLGPLVLDDLHKTGHSRFPVINRDIDHVVGILYVQDLLSTEAKRSITVEKAMNARVHYINQDQTLQHALAAFLRTHHHLFIVVNELRETVGILSLEDVIEALIGKKINDEFDSHEDLRVVAERNAKSNNQPESGVDV